MKKIYLFSLEHLKKDGKATYEKYRLQANSYGYQLIDIGDDFYSLTLSEEKANLLANKKLELLKESDIVVVDCNDFRCDNEPDGEASLTLGIGYGLNKKCYCYMRDTRNHAERYKGEVHVNEQGRLVDENGAFFENDPLNLMLYYSAKLVKGDFVDCLKVIKEEEDVH